MIIAQPMTWMPPKTAVTIKEAFPSTFIIGSMTAPRAWVRMPTRVISSLLPKRVAFAASWFR